MAKQSAHLQALADHELEAADRMKWWGVFLIREKRRLQGIAAAVQGQAKSSIRTGSDDWSNSPDYVASDIIVNQAGG
jgi:hypothetical protein